MQNQEICRKIRCYLYRAELNIDLCEKIQGFLKDKSSYTDKESFFVITANNAFNDTVLIVKSLLGPNKKEISLLKLGSHISDLDKVREEFKQNGFDTMRHQLIAHKDKSISYDGTEHIWQLIRPEYQKKLSEIVEELKSLVYKHFEVKWDQNNPHTRTLKGLHEILEMLK
jgi:hypothetical protein